jgi:aspartate carbamoyltransferase
MGGVPKMASSGIPALPKPFLEESKEEDFVEELPNTPEPKPGKKMFTDLGILPISDGVVIDHLARGESVKEIWMQLERVRRFMDFYGIGASGVYPSSSSHGKLKGLISLPQYPHEFDRKTLKKLGSMAPGCTVNVIKNNTVQRKFRLHMPPRVYNFPTLQCSNLACVSHPKNMQREVAPYFIRPTRGEEKNSTIFLCMYCEQPHQYYEIWVDESRSSK